MSELQAILEKYVDIDLQQVVISGARDKSGLSKVRIRPVLLRNDLLYQCTKTVGAKELHSNHQKEEVCELIRDYMAVQFKQLQLTHQEAVVSVLVSKKGKMTIKHKESSLEQAKKIDLNHNRQKKYILDPQRKVEFLVDLGVMNSEGKIINSRYDKFRQINRFLEFIEDILWRFEKGKEITIVDFGCGKSYLTFAMYHYLKELKGLEVRIVGLDLKEDVIENCNKLSKKYKYDKLSFIKGDIASYDEVAKADMVVTLHACDTATDMAIAKAVKWDAEVILSVPCCQHELNKQIVSEVLSPVLSYGIIKERIAALLTDALRAQLLEEAGYDTQILEFVEMEHTPKNLLIRATKGEKRRKKISNLTECMEFLQVSPMLEKLLAQQEKTNNEEELN